MIIGGDVEPAKFFWLRLSCPDTSPSLDRIAIDRLSRPSSSYRIFPTSKKGTFVFSSPRCDVREREKSRFTHGWKRSMVYVIIFLCVGRFRLDRVDV